MKALGSVTVIGFFLCLILSLSTDVIGEGIESDPVFEISFDGNYVEVYVEPGTAYESTTNGIIHAYMDVLVPGQKIILTLETLSGTWPSNVVPSTLEFTRLDNVRNISITVRLPPETSSSENNMITLKGHWRLDPGTNEGDMPPFSKMIKVMPYSRLNLSADDPRKAAIIGKDVEFRIELKNSGNILDHYHVDIVCDGDCTAETNDLNVTVQEKSFAYTTIVVRQEKGAPGLKTFYLHANGMYRGLEGHMSIPIYLETKLGVATMLVHPWSLIVIVIMILGAVAASFFGGRWILKKGRIRTIGHRGK